MKKCGRLVVRISSVVIRVDPARKRRQFLLGIIVRLALEVIPFPR